MYVYMHAYYHFGPLMLRVPTRKLEPLFSVGSPNKNCLQLDARQYLADFTFEVASSFYLLKSLMKAEMFSV
jgi:hypothetical protein